MKEKTKMIIISILCAILLIFLLLLQVAKAASYSVPKASEQPKGRTYMYSRNVTLHDQSGRKVTVKEYTATNGKKYIGGQ